MRAHRIKKSLLVLALVMGQWLAFAHVLQHPASSPGEQLCQIGLHAQGLDAAAAAPVMPDLPAQILQPAPARSLPAVYTALRLHTYPIRGPPQFS